MRGPGGEQHPWESMTGKDGRGVSPGCPPSLGLPKEVAGSGRLVAWLGGLPWCQLSLSHPKISAA